MPARPGLNRREQEQIANRPRTATFLFRVPSELMETIRLTAAKENRSINNLIQTCVLEGLKERGMLRTIDDIPYVGP